MIPYSRQFIDNDDIKSVAKVLKSNFITQGPLIEKFEKKISNLVRSKYAVAVSSCSAGLHLAAIVSNLKRGKTLLTSPNSFCSTANAGSHCNASVEFADIDIKTGNISLTKIKEKIKKKIDVIIPVHFAGLPVDMQSLKKIISNKKIIIIEDAAHALGAKYKDGTFVGNCKYSDMTVFSFHPVKSITTGEGGVITTNSKKIYEKLKILRSHGIEKNLTRLKFKKNHSNWYYEMQSLGYHYRITDLQCALGISQLKKLKSIINKRAKIAKYYDKFFSKFKNCEPLQFNLRKKSANHLYVLKIIFKRIKKTRQQVMDILYKKGIGTQVHYIPISQQPFYKNKNNLHLNFMTEYYDQCLSIPIFYNLKKKDQDYIISSLREITEI